MTLNIGINGFGRIGRGVFRAFLTKQAAGQMQGVHIKHINDLTPPDSLAMLTEFDSVHGRLSQSVTATDSAMQVGDTKVSLSQERQPENLDWAGKGVDVVFECTGLFTAREKAEAHLKAGAKKVIISAPAKGEDITVVKGVNCQKLDKNAHHIISNGSCTTNCLAPVAKVINDKFGITKGLMTTIHAYTLDQNVLDSGHKDIRRARAAALSMIPTTTGAAKALALVLPELEGKLDGMAIRVPTPNVSVVDVTFEVGKSTSVEEVNAALMHASKNELNGILAAEARPLVSIDFNGNTHSSIVDLKSTNVIGGNMVKILSWYDNETGFSHRMLDVAKMLV